VIEAALSRSIHTVFGLSSVEKVFWLPADETRRQKSQQLVNAMNGFLRYVFNVERIGLGCLQNADLIDPEFRVRDNVIKGRKRDLLQRVSEQYAEARTRCGLFGLLDASTVHAIQIDCNV
jgi:hypothetical protein